MKNFFREAGLPLSLVHRIEQIGFNTPTPIQEKSIPQALKGNDVLGSAQTGTGKTAAFGIPLITHLIQSTNKDGSKNNSDKQSVTSSGVLMRKSKALVLLPTRELALQVTKALQQLIGKSKISIALLIGGEDMRKQLNQLKRGADLIIGTPGRINDHLTRGLNLQNIDFLVLDEVDRMLDMGFSIQIDSILKNITKKRQTLMFSATMPKNIQKLATKYQNNPVRISVGSLRTPTDNVKQEHIKLPDSEKYSYLLKELDSREGSIIVFVKTKYLADAMAKKLRKTGHKVNALHGDLRQNKRTQIVDSFRKQNYRILVATDVAARGLDIPHIQHVINHDLPQCPEDYIHRIGRTARAGATGEAINFLSSSDQKKWQAIQDLMNPDAKTDNSNKNCKVKKYSKSSKNRNNKNNKRQKWQKKRGFAA